MKKRQQVLSLLAARKPASENDRTLILAYCQRHGFKGIYFQQSKKNPNAELKSITNDEFRKWFKTEQFEIGDVVFNETSRTIYLASDYIAGKVFSKIHIDSSEELKTDPIELVKDSSFQKADHKQKLALQRVLAKNKLAWNPLKKNLAERIVPDKNPFVSLWMIEDKMGLGIFKEIDKDGNIILYCYCDNKNSVKYSLDYILGPSLDYTIKMASLQERAILVQELAGVDIYWHSNLKRFEPLNLRKKKGETYFYLGSNWKVYSAVESESESDYQRYKCGNYFHIREQAADFKSEIVLIRRNYLLGNVTPNNL